MICQLCQANAATIHVTERRPEGGFGDDHYCEPCFRSTLAAPLVDRAVKDRDRARVPRTTRAWFCGRCGKEITGRVLECPHCGQSFEDVARCPACHASGILPLDRSIRGRYRKNMIDRRDALSRGFVCEECGYTWNPPPDREA